MRGLNRSYDAAVAAIDSANADDPTAITVRGVPQPLAYVHGVLAAGWVQRLVAEPDDALLLAARAHHLRRWEVPRSTYPEGRAAYLRWRRDQKARHASDVAALLSGAGYDATTIERVQALIRREQVDGAQVVEDAACLVFLETQLGDMVPRFDRGRLLEVIRKTAGKMSPAGLAAVVDVPLADAERALLADALT